MWSLVKYIFGYIKHGRLSKLKHFLMHFCIKIWRQLCRKLLDQKSYIWQPELILMVAQSSKLFLCTFVLKKVGFVIEMRVIIDIFSTCVTRNIFNIFQKEKEKKYPNTLQWWFNFYWIRRQLWKNAQNFWFEINCFLNERQRPLKQLGYFCRMKTYFEFAVLKCLIW